MKKHIENNINNEKCRLDLWLVAARFYKHRNLAVKAIENSRVLVNKSNAKPSRNLKINDEIHIEKEDGVHLVKVLVLAQIRVSAAIAATYYHEDEETKANRLKMQELKKLSRIDFPKNKLDKHQIKALRNAKMGYI